MRAADKARLLRELAQRAAATLGLPAEEISAALLKREALGSTGTGGGVAIPHARLPGVGKPFGMLVRLAKAIDFDAIDGRPVDIVFLLLLPANCRASSSMRSLAAARTLRDPAMVQRVRRAADDAALYRAIIDDREDVLASGAIALAVTRNVAANNILHSIRGILPSGVGWAKAHADRGKTFNKLDRVRRAHAGRTERLARVGTARTVERVEIASRGCAAIARRRHASNALIALPAVALRKS